MKDTRDTETYIPIRKQWNYRIGTVNGEFHWGITDDLENSGLSSVA